MVFLYRAGSQTGLGETFIDESGFFTDVMVNVSKSHQLCLCSYGVIHFSIFFFLRYPLVLGRRVKLLVYLQRVMLFEIYLPIKICFLFTRQRHLVCVYFCTFYHAFLTSHLQF